MKLRNLIPLLTMALFFVGCASNLIGEKVPVSQLGRLSTEDNRLRLESDDYVIYRVEDGKLVVNLYFVRRYSAWGYEIDRLTLETWFTDAEGVILEKSFYYWKGKGQEVGVKMEFIEDLPEGYNDFVFVGFSYIGWYIDESSRLLKPFSSEEYR